MSFCRDRQIRHYCVFLIIFIFLLFLSGTWIQARQAAAARDQFLEHSRAVTSSLLEQGVAEEIIATAITDTSGGEAGEEFLNHIGITEQTATRFFPFVAELQRTTVLPLASAGVLLTVVLFSGTVLFFRGRERLYEQAAQVMRRFSEGDFSCHLPQVGEGAVYQLFASAEQLATTLQSRNDTQEKARGFLKNTISDISHQLKTPLAALSMYHEIISDEPENAGTVRRYAGKMGQALERMELLVGSMLKITRLDAGSIEFEKERCYVTDLISRSIRELTTRAGNEGKKITTEGSAGEQLSCDIKWTGEAIGNIVKNALDHTGPGGEIHISWTRSPAMLRICIADNGTGIALEDIHHIFKRFYRSKKSLDTQGVGLGLSLAKSIIEGQDGVVSVQSCLEEGTTFTLSFLTEL